VLTYEDVGLIVVSGLVCGGVPVPVNGVLGDVVVLDGGGLCSRLEFGGCAGLVGVGSTEVGDGVVGGTCEVVEEGPGGVAGSAGGVAAGSTASATATTPTVASPVPTTAMVRRRERTAWPRWILPVQSGESRPQVVFANHHTSSLR
jgi:hypothetical protein